MPVKDKFHEAVKIGLQREGWTITVDPLYVEFGGVDMYVDLAAEKVIAQQRVKVLVYDAEQEVIVQWFE